MKPDQYSESVAIADVRSAQPIERCLTVCDVSADMRCKTGLTFDPTLTPVDYRDFIVCQTDSTRRRYRSTVHYEPRLRPRVFSDACYVRPKPPESVFASLIDHVNNKTSERKWFSSAVHFNKAIDFACSSLHLGDGASFSVSMNGINGVHEYDCDDNNNDKENIPHHGDKASMRVQTKISPHYTNPGEKIVVVATEGRSPVVMPDLNEVERDAITGGSYKVCWNGKANLQDCDGHINRTRIKIDSRANV